MTTTEVILEENSLATTHQEESGIFTTHQP